MVLLKRILDLQHSLQTSQFRSGTIGFVPTMGALHEGHLSLIKKSRSENKLTVCSIFVNPAQFNDPGDFEKYPITIENDIYLLEKAGCDFLFLPAVNEIYPSHFIKKNYTLGNIENLLEGRYRPGHFQGVCMVVERLLEIVQPHHLYMGQKDYQQCMVINRLLELMDLTATIDLQICPTLREADGLAMSSRNMRLNEEERSRATTIYETLCYIKRSISTISIEGIIATANTMLLQHNLKPDYVAIADAKTLEPVQEWNSKQETVTLIAVYNNEVRLIDNMTLN